MRTTDASVATPPEVRRGPVRPEAAWPAVAARGPSQAAAAGPPPDDGSSAARPPAGPAPLGHALRFELVKLLAQWRVRGALAACWIVPAVFVLAVGRQTQLPADTVFGRWMHASGWAGSLVVLGFCCTWALPLLTALVAGDTFAAEDRLGTWRHLLLVVRSARTIFAAKALSAVAVVVLMVVGLTSSSIAGGLLAGAGRTLVGLSGQPVPAGRAALLVLLAWGCALLGALVYAAVGLLGSVALGRSPMGLAAPALLAVALQGAQLFPLPAVVRLALPSQVLLAWRGLFTAPTQTGPLVAGLLTALAWTAVATAAAYLLFVRRDFANPTDDGTGRRAVLLGVAPLAGLLAASTVVVAVATPARGSGVEQAQVERAVATSFAHLYRLQTDELHRPPVTEQQLATRATCDRAGGRYAAQGPGNDWRCIVTWHLPGAQAVGSAVYQLDVAADGRFVADGDGPKEVNGYFAVRTPYGDQANPLWQVDGLVDLMAPPPSKG
ncbi:ABC transporter permease [Pedococcus sp. NPDC057267]|uniref:ABC transporter permease n=1 Tax=Pedococcus sp. NPDC057267 TaxID=3346077 RepID=UPI00362955E1